MPAVLCVAAVDSALQKKKKEKSNLCGFPRGGLRRLFGHMLGAWGGQGSGERGAGWLESQLGEECRGQTEDPQSV